MTCPDCGYKMNFAREPHADIQYPIYEDFWICPNCDCHLFYVGDYDEDIERDLIDLAYERRMDLYG